MASPRNKRRTRAFFAERLEQSRIKAEIITAYFGAWANIVLRNATKIAYVDLFAGNGRYDNGDPSTPLLILEHAIADPTLRRILITTFNDASPKATEALKREISELAGVDRLKYPPKVLTGEVGPEFAELFQNMHMVPTFAFIDPFGYKGLSRDLIAGLIKDWASEALFFFNYNRISMGLTNQKVDYHMRQIFGDEWLKDLRESVANAIPKEREKVILTALTSGLRELGGAHVLTFRFRRRKDGRTGHYLIFVTKHELGCNVMRDVMAKRSSHHDADGVASFEYDARLEEQSSLEIRERGRLHKLKTKLLTYSAGTMITVQRLFDRHSHFRRCRPFVFANYTEALRQLECEGQVQVERPAGGRMTHGGRPTMQKTALVTFPKR